MRHHLNCSLFSGVSGKLSNHAFSWDTGTGEKWHLMKDLTWIFFSPLPFSPMIWAQHKEVGGAGIRCAGLGALQFRLSAPGSTYPHTSALLSGSAASYLSVSPGAAWAPQTCFMSVLLRDTRTKCSGSLTTALCLFTILRLPRESCENNIKGSDYNLVCRVMGVKNTSLKKIEH